MGTAIDKKLKIKLSGRKSKLSRSEFLIIAVIKQNLGIKTNKSLYNLIKDCGKNYFSKLPSYQQFCIGLESNLYYLVVINTALTELNAYKKTDFFIGSVDF